MSNRMLTIRQAERGITLLITLLFMSVLLGITATLLNVSLKQYKIAGIGYASESAFQAAQAGLECALFHDFTVFGQDLDGNGTNESYIFQVPGTTGGEQSVVPAITCMGSPTAVPSVNGKAVSGEEQLFEFTWGTSPNQRCTSISVYKFKSDTVTVDILDKNGDEMRAADCPVGGECTAIKSRGYNVACNQRTGARVVERELTQIY